jgi:hypothetical protein
MFVYSLRRKKTRKKEADVIKIRTATVCNAHLGTGGRAREGYDMLKRRLVVTDNMERHLECLTQPLTGLDCE